MANLKLVTSKLSPFGHRVELSLIEKNIPYEKVNIDLSQKPDWFIKDSPLGKVPILYIDDKVLFESIAICEYLEDAYPEKPLHPQDNFQKAWNRAWMEYSNGLILSIFTMAFANEEENFKNHLDELNKKIDQIQKYLVTQPYFNGTQISLLDICFASAFAPILFIQSSFGVEIINEESPIFNYANTLVNSENFGKIIPDDYDKIFENLLNRKQSYLLKISTTL